MLMQKFHPALLLFVSNKPTSSLWLTPIAFKLQQMKVNCPHVARAFNFHTHGSSSKNPAFVANVPHGLTATLEFQKHWNKKHKQIKIPCISPTYIYGSTISWKSGSFHGPKEPTLEIKKGKKQTKDSKIEKTKEDRKREEMN